MSTITIQELKRDPDAFLRRVESGQMFLVVSGERVLAEVKPLGALADELRPYGLSANDFHIPDDFDEPLPEDILKDFEGR